MKKQGTMKNDLVKYAVRCVLFAAAVCGWGHAFAQQHPERRHIRAGNRSYEAQDFAAGAEAYRAALAAEPSSFAAAFNLADALYRQGEYGEAAEVLNALAERPDLTPAQKAKVYHNLGNGMFAQQKLQEAADCYKQSLRENPADLETKYNLAYVQKLLEEQQQDGGGDDRNQNQDGDGNQDQNQNQNQNGNGNNKPEEDGNRDEQQNSDGSGQQDDRSDGDGDSEEEGNGDRENRNPDGGDGTSGPERDRQQTAGGMSREDAENILDAMQQQEDRTREKVNAQRAVGVARSGKNW